MKNQLNSIEEALEDIKLGKVVIVVDDEDRENEGDFIIPAAKVSPEVINFMTKHGRGLICAPLLENRCDELDLPLMVKENTVLHHTPFTVSVDLIGNGCTTGISTSDRSKTIQALIDPTTKPSDLGRPGHIFPLRAKRGGVLRRAGHTEAAVDLARLAGFEPAGVLVEILNDDGTMARLPQLLKIADKFDLKVISIADLISYRLQNETLIDQVMEVDLPTKYGDFRLFAFKQRTNDCEHLALVKGNWNENDPVMVRVHSSSLISDVFGSTLTGKGEQLHKAMEMIDAKGVGVIVYVNKHRESTGLIDELNIYQKLANTHEEHKIGRMDAKDYGVGAQILRKLGVRKINLLTNSPVKRTGIVGYDLEIVANTPIQLRQTQIK